MDLTKAGDLSRVIPSDYLSNTSVVSGTTDVKLRFFPNGDCRIIQDSRITLLHKGNAAATTIPLEYHWRLAVRGQWKVVLDKLHIDVDDVAATPLNEFTTLWFAVSPKVKTAFEQDSGYKDRLSGKILTISDTKLRIGSEDGLVLDLKRASGEVSKNSNSSGEIPGTGDSALEDSPKYELLVLKDNSSPNPERTIKFSFRLRPADKTAHVVRQSLLSLPMEYLVFPPEISSGTFVPPGDRDELNAIVIRAVLNISDKVTKPISEKAGFLHEFIDNVPCLHPVSGQQVPFKEFLRYYLNYNGYIQDGYFEGSDLDDDPVGVLLRLLMFDKWILYEAKMIRDDDGSWYSLEDCLKGFFKSRYSHLALESLKTALKLTEEAKEYTRLNLLAKTKAYAGALTNYMNTCLYVVEANRSLMQQSRLTSNSYEKIRAMAFKGKLFAHYRKSLRVAVVETLD